MSDVFTLGTCGTTEGSHLPRPASSVCSRHSRRCKHCCPG